MNRIKDYKQLAEDISTWIKDYATTNNIKSLVVGVSGGIDSAVVSTLCCLTGLPTYLMQITVGESNDKHFIQAMKHIRWLEQRCGENVIHCRPLDISGALEEIISSLAASSDHNHATANLKSRLRMCLLYHMATTQQGIVVGTGNKVEDFGVKFFSKYGDGGVDISPIGDLKKSEVRELGRYLGVSEEIINTKPTDGLWADGRCDEDQLLCTYDELEWAMDYYEDIKGKKLVITELDSLTLREKEVLERYTELYHKGMHKVQLPPVFRL